MTLTELEPPALDLDLPEGWATVSLKDACHSRKGKKPEHLASSPEEQVLPYIDIHAFEKAEARQYADVKSSIVVEAGVLLVVWDGARCGLVGRSPFKGALGSTLLAIEAPGLDRDYLFWFLRGQFQRVNSNPRGTGIPHVDPNVFWETELPLPPLAEQRRIVTKVEQVLAAARASRERLARVPALMKRFRQSVLAAACAGRLTADWREQNPDAEPASRLLERILAERRARWEAEQVAKKRGKAPSLGLDVARTLTAQEKAKYQKPAAPDTSELLELPESWCWARLDDLLHHSRSAGYGVLQPGGDLLNGIPMVRVCDIHNGTVLVDQLKHIAPEIDRQYQRTRLYGDEVLVTLVGTIGRTAVAPETVAGANIARAVGMFPLSKSVLPRFVQMTLAEPEKNSELVELSREVARKTLNLGLIKEVNLPVPPLAEQQEIVRRVEALFKFADAIERRTAVAAARADRLVQAVLAKAFRGELVPTEAELARAEGRDYEPASALLGRLRAEREQAAARRSPGGRQGAWAF